MLTGRLPFASGDIKALFEKIVNDAVELPKYLSCNARSILSGLLEKSPSKRIGSTQNDLGEIKAHQFFSSIDWTRLFSKDMQPPFRPQVTSDIDTRYFDKEFTGENVQITPPNGTIFDRHATSNPIKHFDSFSFYGSKSSLGSNQQMSCLISSANGSSTSLNKNEMSKSSDSIQEIDFIYQDSYSYSMDYVDGDCPNGYLTSILYDTQIPTVDIQMQLLRNFNFYEANMLNTTQQSSQTDAFLMQHSHDINSTVTEMEI
jgi:serine/threonine protein kinase